MKEIQESQLKGLFYFLAIRSPRKVFLSIIIGVIGGTAYSLMIPFVLLSITQNTDYFLETIEQDEYMLMGFEIVQFEFAVSFLLLCVFILVTRSMSQWLFQNVVIESCNELRVYFCQRVNQLPIINLEKIGEAELTASLTNDVPGVVSGAAVFPIFLANIATLIGILGFLIVLNSDVFVFVLCIILIGMITYRVPLQFSQKYFTEARRVFSLIIEDFNAIIGGAKELKLHSKRRNVFMEESLMVHVEENTSLQKKGRVIDIFATNYGNMISFITIGILAFVIANAHDLSNEALIGTIMALLYTVGPVAAILNSISSYVQGSISLQRLRYLLSIMPVEELESQTPVVEFEQITLEDVVHSYDGDDSFTVGPINLTFKAGQISFLIGGNGSGKSTLSKVVTCHYQPGSGEVWFGNQRICGSNLESARQYISAIYTDFYLFTHLFGMSQIQLEQVDLYLKELRLDNVVSINNGRFSSTRLSDGQRKRLALLVAFLDDRKVYLFDEWAADQDPIFKEFFYRQLLPKLKEQGKIVLVISHDDKYFDCADQLIRLGDGNVQSVQRNDHRCEQVYALT